MNERRHTFSRLMVDLAEGQYSADELEAVELLLEAEGLERAPSWVVERARRISRQRRPAAATGGVLQRLVATLAFDTRQQPRPVGVRSLDAPPRRLLFRADGIDVDIEVLPSMQGLRVLGQVTVEEGEPLPGTLRLTSELTIHDAMLDESGEFIIDPVLPGSYRLELHVQGRVVEIPNLPI
jgi:hypothetical protein